MQAFRSLPGDIIAWGEGDGEKVPLLSVDDGKIETQFDWEQWKQFILLESYTRQTAPFYARLPFHYHYVPERVRSLALKFLLALNKNKGTQPTDFPGHPIEQGFELLHYLYCNNGGTASWESSVSGQIFLTHDIDTRGGFEWALKTAAREKKYGFRSLWNVVGNLYKIDYDALDELRKDGFEIGLHGYNHDNKDAFLSEDALRKRFDRCKPLIERYGMKSYRSPSWLRTPMLFDVLKDYISTDFSRLDSDILCPGGQGGCLWTKGFEYGGLLQIPSTVPYEYPLFVGYKPDQLLNFWTPKLKWLRKINGNIVVNTHPDTGYSGNQAMLDSYEQLLIYLNDN